VRCGAVSMECSKALRKNSAVDSPGSGIPFTIPSSWVAQVGACELKSKQRAGVALPITKG
jgi:hypothetical protein